MSRLKNYLYLSSIVFSLSACRTKSPDAALKEEVYTPVGGTQVQVPAEIPEANWQELVRIGAGNPQNVVIFKGDGLILAINVDDPAKTVKKLTEPGWTGYHKCLEKREYLSPDKSRQMYVGCTHLDGGEGCQGPVEVYKLENGVRGAFSQMSTEKQLLKGKVMSWDPSHSFQGNWVAFISRENGTYFKDSVDGRPSSPDFVQTLGHQELWVAEADKPWGEAKKYQLTENDGSWEVSHPSWSGFERENGSWLVYDTTVARGQSHLRVMKNSTKDHVANRERYDVFELTPPGLAAQDPIWIKYRDIPKDDIECQNAVKAAMLVP